MSRWIALLRGVNVGGGNVVEMAALRAALTERGAAFVATYIQSGNIVIDLDSSDRARVTDLVTATLADEFALTPAVVVLTVDELGAAIAAVPFDVGAADPKLVHLFFGATAIDPAAVDALAAYADPDDELAVDDSVLYVHTPGGFGRSRIGGRIATTVDVEVTGRNLRSATKILELARS